MEGQLRPDAAQEPPAPTSVVPSKDAGEPPVGEATPDEDFPEDFPDDEYDDEHFEPV